MALPTLGVKDKDIADQTINTLNSGRQAASDSASTVLSTEDLAAIGSLTETAPVTDTASSGLNGRFQRVAQRLTSFIALFPASLGSKAAASSLAVTASTEDIARDGIITETAPTTDTASSGLNGRLQRIAQRLTSLIALFPASLGSKSDAASFAVTQSTEDKAALASVLAKLATLTKVSSATLSSLASAATSAQLLPLTSGRAGLIIHNTDANDLHIKYGTTATTAIGGYTWKIGPDAHWVMDQPIYTGRIDAIWAANGSGGASITEI